MADVGVDLDWAAPPAARSAAGAPRAPLAVVRTRSGEVGASRREHSALIVDPDAEQRAHIADVLAPEYCTASAPDAARALDAAVRCRPTLVITELELPDVDGLELTRRLRREPSTRHVPIVMVSARNDAPDRVRSLDAGVNAHLGKPFAPRELASTARALLRSQEQTAELLLSEKLHALGCIASGLAHEINNPLNCVQNALACVQRDCDVLLAALRSPEFAPPGHGKLQRIDGRMQRMFEVSRAGVQRIAATVELMLRYGAEGSCRVPKACDVFAAVKDVVQILTPRVPSGVAVAFDLCGDGCVFCAAEDLNQVLTSIVQNALEAVPGGGQGRLEIRGRKEGSSVVLSIKDNGPGIAERDRSRIFDPFFTTKQASLGLGLTIARRVIAGLGGTLTVHGEPGSGAEFQLRIPRGLALEAAE